MSDELPRLRALLGASTVLWAGEDGVRVEEGRWVALSGARAVDYNVAFCHAASDGEAIERSLAEIAAAGAPAVVMVAGGALGDVQHLVQAGWVCVGSVPFMTRPLGSEQVVATGEVRRLRPEEVEAARNIVDEVFGVGPELAQVALPDSAATAPGQSVWGGHDAAGRLVSCLGAVRVDDAVAIWSMATATARRREGHGARLLLGVLADAQADGASRSLLHASPDGEPFYRSLGYEPLERWQLWSRPRWVLGRS